MEMISARYLQPGPVAMPEGHAVVSRHAVTAIARAATRGVKPVTAQQLTKIFYRSSGHAWAQSLRD
jgi:hypothetical protein